MKRQTGSTSSRLQPEPPAPAPAPAVSVVLVGAVAQENTSELEEGGQDATNGFRNILKRMEYKIDVVELIVSMALFSVAQRSVDLHQTIPFLNR